MEELKVKEYSDLIRNTNSKAIINTNTKAYNEAVQRANAFKNNKKEVESLKEEINNIKSDVSEIKDLLMRVLEK